MSDPKLNETQYRLERESIRDTYGDNAAERAGSFDQALAVLFARSGWTQEELARVEKRSQAWVACRLRLGRFLANITTVIIPKNLTEGRFRSYWERTTGINEHIRFRDVARLMESELTLSKNRSNSRLRSLAEEILDKFGDGQWHHLATILEKTAAEPADADTVLTQMRTRGTYDTLCERRKGGASWDYRIVRGRGKKVDAHVLVKELGPIVHAFDQEARKPDTRWSRGTIRKLVHDLKKTIERLAHTSIPHSRGAVRLQEAIADEDVSTDECESSPSHAGPGAGVP